MQRILSIDMDGVLVLRLREPIVGPLVGGFPTRGKVVELCLLGRNHG